MATHCIFLPGEPHGQSGLVGYSPWGCKESDTIGAIEHIIKMKVPFMKMLSRYSSLLKFNTDMLLRTANSISQHYPPPHVQ